MCNVYLIENRDKVNETIARLDETYRETCKFKLSKDEWKELCGFWDALFGGTKFDELGISDGNIGVVDGSLIGCFNPLVNKYIISARYNTDWSVSFSLIKFREEDCETLENRVHINDVSKITEEILNDIFDKFTKVAEEDNILAIESSDDGLVRVVTDYNYIL